MKNEYRIYIRNNCLSCNRIAHFIKEKNINIRLINIDLATDYQLPVNVMIFPALLLGNNIIAYGDDIIQKLSA
jgi:glutaredoxin